MDSQGASFSFDPSMDFSAAFATPQPPSQLLLAKSVEDDTSAFFGDEGIDTATYMDPNVFNTVQEHLFVSPNLAMDHASSSTSVWDTQLASQMQHSLSTFPPTPVQSFNSMYQLDHGTSLGKRPLQLDQLEFPLAKRHESMSNVVGDFTLFSSMPSTASVTTSDWALDAQLTPPVSTTEFGLSDEAADVCATWFQKFNVLPSDRHIESLGQLTGESADAIRSWFGRLLKQGMSGSQGDSAYKSQTYLTQHEPFWNASYSTEILQASPSQLLLQQVETPTTPEAICSHTTTTVQPAAALRRNRKRCTPTDDPQLLCRDPSKIYQCTRKCGKRYGRKCDWKRNEEEGYPCKSWMCSLCTSDGVENVKPCFRKYHFVQHFRNIHPGVDAEFFEETSIVCSETEFPKNCGFCPHRFVSRQDRIDHIADHFKAGKSMLEWREEESNDGHDTNNNDDDDNDDDGSNGDGSDGAYSHPPSSFDPRGDGGSKYHGRDNGGGGDDAGGHLDTPSAPGGLFQNHRSHADHINDRPRSSPTDNYTAKGGDEQDDRNQLSASLDMGENIEPGSLAGTWSARDKQSPTAEDCQISLARVELSQPIVKQPLFSQPFIKQPIAGKFRPIERANDLVDDHPTHCDQVIKDNPITSGLECRPSLDLEKETSSLVEANASCTTIANRPRDPENRSGSSKDALRSSTSSYAAPSALRRKLPQCVPPNSRLFLSVKLLGAGGFSTVDEVVHRQTRLRLGRKTLKNRDESAVEEAKKEISVLQKLRHPHIIRFLDAYSKGDKMSMLLSPVAETTLALWLDRTVLQKPNNLSETIVKMFGCLVSSVRYLHEQRPVVNHMDIKPQNILILDGDSALPQVVLCDFGISSSEDPSGEHVLPVTRQYTAPEVFQGSLRKQAADIWSLGCVFAEMASVPFSQGNTGWSDFRQVFSGRSSKYYWQDVPEVQTRLSTCLDGATTTTEQAVARTLKTMLSARPSERPDAASLTMIFTPAPCCLNWPNDNAVFPGPREELDWVERLEREECVGCHAQQHIRDVTPEPASNEVSIAAGWLKDCSKSHSACYVSSSSDTTVLPRRLVDLLPDGQSGSYIRVVNSIDVDQTSDRIEYVTTSHAWTHDQPLLSRDSMSDLQSGLPLDQLPDALNKAIAITQRLGYRYMWTDSLCVIQDSMTDKQQQCKAMASIFRNATLTIVLDQLTTNDAKRAPLAQSLTNHQHAPTHTSPSQTNAHQPPAFEIIPATAFTTPGFAWDTRAWVLQERLLSRRFLHLGKQLYWECNTLKASATLPRGLAPLLWEKLHSRLRLPHAQAIAVVPSGANKSSRACGTCTCTPG